MNHHICFFNLNLSKIFLIIPGNSVPCNKWAQVRNTPSIYRFCKPTKLTPLLASSYDPLTYLPHCSKTQLKRSCIVNSKTTSHDQYWFSKDLRENLICIETNLTSIILYFVTFFFPHPKYLEDLSSNTKVDKIRLR